VDGRCNRRSGSVDGARAVVWLIVEHRLGFIMQNAGVDRRKLGPTGWSPTRVLRLPENPVRSAKALSRGLAGADRDRYRGG